MYRITLTTLVVLAIIGGFAAQTVLAEQVKCEGAITKIEGEMVTVKDSANKDQQMMVVPATKVMLDGKAAKASDLKVGQHVKCTCDKQGDKMTCNAIEATTK